VGRMRVVLHMIRNISIVHCTPGVSRNNNIRYTHRGPVSVQD
jgi:hypothetical protein